MLDQFKKFLAQDNNFYKWFGDHITIQNVDNYLVEDFEEFGGDNVVEFLNSKYPRIQNWFQDKSLWEKLKDEIIKEYLAVNN